MNYELKEMLDAIYGLCDSLNENDDIGPSSLGLDVTLRNVFRVEATRFLMYLSSADGEVSYIETKLVNDYLQWNISNNEMKEYIKENDLQYEAFEDNIPTLLMVFVHADNMYYKYTHTTKLCLSELLFKAFGYLGKEMLTCDDNVTTHEIKKYTSFLEGMKDYIEEKLNYYHEVEMIEDFILRPSVNSFNNTNANNHTSNKDQVINTSVEPEETLDELLEELNSLIGLTEVKKDVNSLINLLQINKIREERGMKKMPVSLHLVFSGNPGTGKTTVARLLAKIYHKLGVLSQGHLVEVDRSGLVGGYVGQTAIKVQDVLKKSLGGVLFIDEAYSLTANKSENDFGFEAVDTLLKGMEDNRNDLIVIVAGYPKLMNEFLNSNPGLRSRFNKFINFVDYNPTELFNIFMSLAEKSGYNVSDKCQSYIRKFFENRYINRNSNFANGRDVRNFFELAIVNQANRLVLDTSLTNEELSTIEFEDVENISL